MNLVSNSSTTHLCGSSRRGWTRHPLPGSSYAVRLSPMQYKCTRLLGRMGMIVASSTGKGFSQSTGKPASEKKSKKGGRKAKKSQKEPSSPQMAGGVEQRSREPAPFDQVKVEEFVSAEEIQANVDFEKRLKELEKTSEVQKAKLEAENRASNDILRPNYDNPPPLTSTLFDTNSSKEVRKTSAAEEGSFGPSQVVLGALSLLLIGIFLVANGGSELGYATKRQSQGASVALSPEQKKDVEAELEKMESRLTENPDDLEALESSAVLKTQLGDFKEASLRLEKLVAARSDDQDALRVLGETYAAQGNAAKATENFRKAFAASKSSSIEILTLLTDSLMQSGKQKDAIEEVAALRASASATASPELGDVELGMLQAKLYAQWKGHVPNALNIYEELCNEHPEDFRPFLGRGLLLQQEGRPADAQRAFVQAQYLAPPSSKATVDAIIKGK